MARARALGGRRAVTARGGVTVAALVGLCVTSLCFAGASAQGGAMSAPLDPLQYMRDNCVCECTPVAANGSPASKEDLLRSDATLTCSTCCPVEELMAEMKQHLPDIDRRTEQGKACNQPSGFLSWFLRPTCWEVKADTKCQFPFVYGYNQVIVDCTTMGEGMQNTPWCVYDLQAWHNDGEGWGYCAPRESGAEGAAPSALPSAPSPLPTPSDEAPMQAWSPPVEGEGRSDVVTNETEGEVRSVEEPSEAQGGDDVVTNEGSEEAANATEGSPVDLSPAARNPALVLDEGTAELFAQSRPEGSGFSDLMKEIEKSPGLKPAGITAAVVGSVLAACLVALVGVGVWKWRARIKQAKSSKFQSMSNKREASNEEIGLPAI